MYRPYFPVVWQRPQPVVSKYVLFFGRWHPSPPHRHFIVLLVFLIISSFRIHLGESNVLFNTQNMYLRCKCDVGNKLYYFDNCYWDYCYNFILWPNASMFCRICHRNKNGERRR